MPRFLLGLASGLALAMLMACGSSSALAQSSAPRTQVVGVCDQRGNLVYTTSLGGIAVLPHWEGC